MLDHSISPEIRPYPPAGIADDGGRFERTVFQTLLERLQAGDARIVPVATRRPCSMQPTTNRPSNGARKTSCSSTGVCSRRSAGWPIPTRRWRRSSTPCAGSSPSARRTTSRRSFVSCLRVVGCSPLSPLPYCGLVDAEEVRDFIRCAVRRWLLQTLTRYPSWVREAIVEHPDWVETRLARNPQWINEEVRRVALEGDLFA